MSITIKTYFIIIDQGYFNYNFITEIDKDIEIEQNARCEVFHKQEVFGVSLGTNFA